MLLLVCSCLCSCHVVVVVVVVVWTAGPLGNEKLPILASHNRTRIHFAHRDLPVPPPRRGLCVHSQLQVSLDGHFNRTFAAATRKARALIPCRPPDADTCMDRNSLELSLEPPSSDGDGFAAIPTISMQWGTAPLGDEPERPSSRQ